MIITVSNGSLVRVNRGSVCQRERAFCERSYIYYLKTNRTGAFGSLGKFEAAAKRMVELMVEPYGGCVPASTGLVTRL